jgi:hypothetical protein
VRNAQNLVPFFGLVSALFFVVRLQAAVPLDAGSDNHSALITALQGEPDQPTQATPARSRSRSRGVYHAD